MPTVPKCTAKTDMQESALEEARQVAGWADELTPEWIRAIGALRDAFTGTKFESKLDAQYTTLLENLANKPDPYDDFGVVVRQLREREYARAAFTAAKIGADLHRDSSYLASVAANCAGGLGDAATALEYNLRAAEQLDLEDHPDTRRAWEIVVSRATALGNTAATARAQERIAALAGK